MTSPSPILSFDRAAKTRGTHRTPALRGVSLSIASGEVALLVGPSGSGKTTLLALAAGLLLADTGSISVAGSDLARLDAARRRRLRAGRIGMVFQRAHLLPALSVRENVELAGLVADLSRAEAGARADELLEALGIDRLARRRAGELSGGQEQRVAVARALVHRPALLLADEPTASLDTTSGREVARLLCALARQRGAAVIVATHDQRLESIASRRLQLVDGRIDDDVSCP